MVNRIFNRILLPSCSEVSTHGASFWGFMLLLTANASFGPPRHSRSGTELSCGAPPLFVTFGGDWLVVKRESKLEDRPISKRNTRKRIRSSRCPILEPGRDYIIPAQSTELQTQKNRWWILLTCFLICWSNLQVFGHSVYTFFVFCFIFIFTDLQSRTDIFMACCCMSVCCTVTSICPILRSLDCFSDAPFSQIIHRPKVILLVMPFQIDPGCSQGLLPVVKPAQHYDFMQVSSATPTRVFRSFSTCTLLYITR